MSLHACVHEGICLHLWPSWHECSALRNSARDAGVTPPDAAGMVHHSIKGALLQKSDRLVTTPVIFWLAQEESSAAGMEEQLALALHTALLSYWGDCQARAKHSNTVVPGMEVQVRPAVDPIAAAI